MPLIMVENHAARNSDTFVFLVLENVHRVALCLLVFVRMVCIVMLVFLLDDYVTVFCSVFFII